jgi:hypothetical protein
VDYVPLTARETRLDAVLTVDSGFGGLPRLRSPVGGLGVLAQDTEQPPHLYSEDFLTSTTSNCYKVT